MTTALVVLGALAVVAVLVVLLISTRYGKVYSDAHLIEVCEALDRVRDHACARPEWEGEQAPPGTVEETLADPRNAETSAGLRVAYTVSAPRENPERHRHYVSMSQADRLPAEAMTRFFVGLLLVRYGLPPEAVAVVRSPNLVTHVAWEMPADERLRFAAAHLDVPDTRGLHELRKSASAAGRAITLSRLAVPATTPPGGASGTLVS